MENNYTVEVIKKISRDDIISTGLSFKQDKLNKDKIITTIDFSSTGMIFNISNNDTIARDNLITLTKSLYEWVNSGIINNDSMGSFSFDNGKNLLIKFQKTIEYKDGFKEFSNTFISIIYDITNTCTFNSYNNIISESIILNKEDTEVFLKQLVKFLENN